MKLYLNNLFIEVIFVCYTVVMIGFFKRKLPTLRPESAINQIVARNIAPMLKEKGFKKVGRTWIKDSTDYSFIINVQANRLNNSETDAAFAINYGIYVPSVYQLLFGSQRPKSPKEYDCVLRKRIVESDGKEVWWNIYDHADIAKLGQDIEPKISSQCLKLFNEINSLSNVVDQVQPSLIGGTSWSLLTGALLYAELGTLKKAESYFKQAYKVSSDNTSFQSKVKLASKAYGINI